MSVQLRVLFHRYRVTKHMYVLLIFLFDHEQHHCSFLFPLPILFFWLTHLLLIKSHVIAHDVELHSPGTSVTFDPVSIEGEWVAQLVAQWQGKAEITLLAKSVQHVEHSAAGRLVGLEKHDVGMGLTGAQRGPLSVRGGEDGACSWLNTAVK